MTGNVQFYSAAQGSTTYTALGNAISTGALPITQTFTDNFTPTDPCFGGAVSSIGVSFSGMRRCQTCSRVSPPWPM